MAFFRRKQIQYHKKAEILCHDKDFSFFCISYEDAPNRIFLLQVCYRGTEKAMTPALSGAMMPLFR